MDLLLTPDERFADLPDFDFPVRRDVVEGLTIASVDVGSGPDVLLMHGEPSWSFLYRSMIPPLVDAGFRVVAPDLVGFGRSSKPASIDDHTYAAHVRWMSTWLRTVDLDGATLFCQDWGGLIGLRMVAGEPDRFARVAVSNTGLPTGDRRMPEAFHRWQRSAREMPEFSTGSIVAGGTTGGLSEGARAAYDAPFPDESYKSGPRAMPGLVPTSPDDPESEPNRQAWSVLRRWSRPWLTLFSDSDPITVGGERAFHESVPGCEGQPHRTIEGAGHFVQEDAGPELAIALIVWMG